jgi:hypothetical protein
MATPKKKTEIAARPQQAERRATVKTETAAATGLPSSDDVRLRAFQLWEEGGCQPGQDLENWLRAEGELRNARRV